MNSIKKADLTDLVDEHPLSRFQFITILFCALIAMLDGFDTQMIAFVAPSIATDWDMDLSSFGVIFSAGLLGGLIGAIWFGTVADRHGRRLVLLLSVIIMGVGSLLTAQASSPTELIVYRFFTSLGLGGAMPSIITLTSEYSPKRLRATLTIAMFSGFPLGAVIGAVASTGLIEAYGWRSVFVVGGAVPLLLLPLLAAYLPESIRWLSLGNSSHAIRAVLVRMRRADLWDGSLPTIPEEVVSQAGVRGLFEDGRGFGTVLLWITFFISLLLVFLLVSWIPSIAVQAGHSLERGALAAAALNLGGILGSICIGRLVDKRGPFIMIGSAYVLGALVVAALGLGTNLHSTIFWFSAIAGFFCIGAQMSAVALASSYYSVEVRATGIGWAMGIGRFGAIGGPLVGSLFIGSGEIESALFIMLSLLSMTAGLAIFVMGRVTRSLRAAPCPNTSESAAG